MSDLLIRNVSPKLYQKLNKLAAMKGFLVQQVIIKALESYLQAAEIEERLEQISDRQGVSIDPKEISKIIKNQRNKRP